MTRSDVGQALVEFALVLPFLLLFGFALVFITQIGVARLALEHAAAEGARAGALTNDDAEIRRAAFAALAPLDPASVELVVEPRQDEAPRTWDPRGSIIRVSLARVVAAPLAFGGLPSVTLRATAARLVEWTP